jgi:hypothetical protein
MKQKEKDFSFCYGFPVYIEFILKFFFVFVEKVDVQKKLINFNFNICVFQLTLLNYVSLQNHLSKKVLT